MHHSSAEIGLDSSTSVPKVASFEDEGGDKFVELIDVEGSVHSGGELGGYGVVDVGDRASDTEGKGMQMNFSTWLHVRLGTLEIQTMDLHRRFSRFSTTSNPTYPPKLFRQSCHACGRTHGAHSFPLPIGCKRCRAEHSEQGLQDESIRRHRTLIRNDTTPARKFLEIPQRVGAPPSLSPWVSSPICEIAQFIQKITRLSGHVDQSFSDRPDHM